MKIRILLISFILTLFAVSTYGVFKIETNKRNTLHKERKKTLTELALLLQVQGVISKTITGDPAQFHANEKKIKILNETKIRRHFYFLSLKIDEWMNLLNKVNLSKKLNSEGLDYLKEKINNIQKLASANRFKNLLLLTQEYKKNEMITANSSIESQKKLILKFAFDGQEILMINSPLTNTKLLDIQKQLSNIPLETKSLPLPMELSGFNETIRDLVTYEIENKRKENLRIIKKLKEIANNRFNGIAIAFGVMCFALIIVFYSFKKMKHKKPLVISNEALSFFEYLSSTHEKPLFVVNSAKEITWSNNAFIEDNLEKLIYEGETLCGRSVKEVLPILGIEQLQVKNHGTFDVIKLDAPSFIEDLKIYILDSHSGNIFSSLEKALAKLSPIAQKNQVEISFDSSLLNMSEKFVDNREGLLIPFVGQALRYLIEEKNKNKTTSRKINIFSFIDEKNSELEICFETSFCRISESLFRKYIFCLSFAKDIHCRLKICNVNNPEGELKLSKVIMSFPLNRFHKNSYHGEIRL